MLIFFIIFFAVAVVVAIVAVLIHIVSRMPSYTYRQGVSAERKVAKELATLPQEEYITLNDLMLTTSYGTTQIDHVVLSTYGVYVIETKDCRGNITGDENSEQLLLMRKIRYNLNRVLSVDYHVRSFVVSLSIVELPIAR